MTGIPAALRIARHELPWLAGAIALGGGIGPVLLMWGLAHASASSASLLLNAEGDEGARRWPRERRPRPRRRHTHRHHHDAVTHSREHFPDAHHRHEHGEDG